MGLRKICIDTILSEHGKAVIYARDGSVISYPEQQCSWVFIR